MEKDLTSVPRNDRGLYLVAKIDDVFENKRATLPVSACTPSVYAGISVGLFFL